MSSDADEGALETKPRTLDNCAVPRSSSLSRLVRPEQRLHHVRPVHHPPKNKRHKSHRLRVLQRSVSRSTDMDKNFRQALNL